MALAAQLLTRSEAIVAADTQRHLGRENCNSRHIEFIVKEARHGKNWNIFWDN